MLVCVFCGSSYVLLLYVIEVFVVVCSYFVSFFHNINSACSILLFFFSPLLKLVGLSTFFLTRSYFMTYIYFFVIIDFAVG